MKLKKILIAMLLIGFACSVPGYSKITETAARLQTSMTMVVDPGHGGMDGGAAGIDGTKESSINLQIARALAEEAQVYGIKVILTRETEDGLYRENAGGRWSKVEDLKARKQIIEESNPDVAVSIHLNSFIADSAVHGAQVFYPGEGDPARKEKNKLLAEAVQNKLKENLGGNGNRIVLPKNGVYLLKNEETMILVECGFLSNSEDLRNLKNPVYQKKIARSIMEGIGEIYQVEKKEKSENSVIDSRTKAEG